MLLAGPFASGCVFIDDFGKFKVDENKQRDSGARGPDEDAGPSDEDAQTGDGGARGQDSGAKCKQDCAAMANDCTSARCNETSGECETMAVNEGRTCFDDNPCTFAEQCRSGACVGQALDCSAYDDECSQGICDTEAGGCTFGPNRMSQSCNDANPCSLNDRCNDEGLCISESNAAMGASCDDFNSCSGIDGMADQCDGRGRCLPGGPVAAGTVCNDDNECSSGDVCDGDGECTGTPTREGQKCNAGCSSNTTCQTGFCQPTGDEVTAFTQGCFLNWCGRASLCQTSWQHDRVCDCGCSFDDPDCTSCSARMCENDPDRGHRATSWCNQDGNAIGNCPDSLKNDGKCDCGCQFADPDCGGGSCCGPTGKAGCDNSFVQRCLCEHESNEQPDCCSKGWTQQCADLAVSLGCMTCP
jgi:hypothetical protein